MEEDGANDTHVKCQQDATVDAMVALYLFLMDNSILSHFELRF